MDKEEQKQTISALTRLAEEYTNGIKGATSRREFEDTKKYFKCLTDVLNVIKPLKFFPQESYEKLRNNYFQIYSGALDVFVHTLKPGSKTRAQIYGELELIMKKVA